MKKQGTIARWDAAQQHGYIHCPQTPTEVYFHIRDYDGPHPVKTGTAVVFEEIHVGGKGPRALAVKLPPPPPLVEAPVAAAPQAEPVLAPAAAGASGAALWRERRDNQRRSAIAVGLFAGWCLLWLLGIGFGRLPWVVLTGVVLVNIATLFLYWRDQQVAELGGWPWPVEHLHVAALLGGWPAAWMAQQALGHRLQDTPFQRAFLASAVANALALLLWVGWPLLAA